MFKLDRLILLIALCTYSFFTYEFYFVCDDAFISFRYGKNLAEGFGLRYNLGDHLPVEGYTNFLWVLLAGLGLKLGFSLEYFMPILSYLSGLLFLAILYRSIAKDFKFSPLVAALSVLLLSIFPPFFIWSTGGLETMPFALFMFLTFRSLFLKPAPVLAGAFALILSLLRFDGIFWSLFLGSIALFVNKKNYRFFLTLLLPYLTYYLWRYNYYHELLPNTVINKVSFTYGYEYLWRSASNYIITFFLTFPLLGLCLLGLNNLFKTRTCFWPLFLLLIAHLSYVLLVGGDFMSMGRFFIPFAFIPVVFFAAFLQSIGGKCVASLIVLLVIICNLLPAYNLHLVPEFFRKNFHFRLSNEEYVSESDHLKKMKWMTHRGSVLAQELTQLSPKGGSVVASAIGSLGYYSNFFIYDRLGLVSPEIARLTVYDFNKSPAHYKSVLGNFFVEQQPTFLKALILPRLTSEEVLLRKRRYWRKKYYQVGYKPVYYEIEQKDFRGEHLAIWLIAKKSLTYEK